MVVDSTPYSSDYLVVGAGFVGLCCALQIIQRHPNKKVTILDADVAGGATALRSSAMYMRFGFSPTSQQMVRDSIKFYDDMTGFGPHIWENHPFYWVLDAASQPQYGGCLLSKTTPASERELDLIGAQIPKLQLDADEALYFDPLVHRAKPEKLHAALLSAVLAPEHTRLVEGCSVRGVRNLGAKGIGVATDFGEFIASDVAVCVAGAVKEPAFKRFFDEYAVRAKKIVSFYIPFADFSVNPVGFAFPSDEVYLMPDLRKKRWMLSVTSQEWDPDIHNRRFSFTAEELKHAQAFISQRFGMDAARIMGAAVYGDAYSPTRTPFVLRPSEFDGKLAIATGTSGYGLKVAPALAQTILEKENARAT